MSPLDSEPTKLSYGDWRATVAPLLGGAVLSLTKHGRDILRPAASVDAVSRDPREAACFPCVPYFGRLYNGLDCEGQHWDLAPTLPECDPQHALHGHGWTHLWRVKAQTAHSLTIAFDYMPIEGGFPYAFAAEQKFSLTASGLVISLCVTSTARSMPAGLGLHPYFTRTADTRLTFTAAKLWSPPTSENAGHENNIPPHLNFYNGVGLPHETVDHSFDGFGGHVLIEQAGRRLTLVSDAPILHLYAPGDESYFCLEPVTHLPGRFGDKVLAQDASLTIEMRLGAADA